MPQKTIVIAGGSRGFGLATARACLTGGANVVICSEDLADVRAAEALLGAREELSAVKCDVTVPSDIEHLIATTLRHFGRIDAFVNNAGGDGVFGKTADVPIARGRRMLAVDVLGAYYCLTCVLRQMEQQGSGRFVHIVGRGATSGAPYSSLQAAAKAWLTAFTAVARAEYAGSGVEIGTYDPGICLSSEARNVMAINGEEQRIASVRWLTRVLGAPAEVPGAELARILLATRPLPAQTDHASAAVTLSRAFLRLVLRKTPPFVSDSVVARLIPAERSLLSN